MNNLLDFDDYILEVNEKELQEEILNEGLKDWLKKAALTTAVATCCLNLAAAPKEKVDELPQEKDKIENVQNSPYLKDEFQLRFYQGDLHHAWLHEDPL